MRRWLRIVGAVVLLITSVGAPIAGTAAAQPGLPDSGGINDSGDSSGVEGVNSSAGGNTTNSSESNETGSSGEDGGVLGGGGLMPSMPTAGEWLEQATEWGWEDLQSGTAGYVDSLSGAFVGIAAPGEPFAPATWVMPDGGMWGVPTAMYVAGASISSVLYGGAFVYMFDVKSRQKQREILRTILRSLAATVFGMPLLGLYFNGIDVISTGIAPDGTEFVQTGGGITQLALGHLIVLILMTLNSGVVVVGGLIMYAIYLLPIVLFAFWPYITASKALAVKPLQSSANLGLATLGMLPILRFTQSLLLRLAKMMTWEASGVAAQIASLLGTGIILTFALLILPWIFYKNIETASGMALSTITVKQADRGVSKVSDAASSTASRAGGRAKQAAAPYVNRARSVANQKAANAKRRAGSRMGGVMLDAKFGRSGSSQRSVGGSSGSSPQGSTSKPSGRGSSSGASSGGSGSGRSGASRRRAIRRQRRNAQKRRSQRGD